MQLGKKVTPPPLLRWVSGTVTPLRGWVQHPFTSWVLSSMESKAHAVTVTATGIKCPSSIRAKGNINIYTVLSCEQCLHVTSIDNWSLTVATRLNYVEAGCHVEHVKDKAQETRCVPGVFLRNLAGKSAAFFTITIITVSMNVSSHFQIISWSKLFTKSLPQPFESLRKDSVLGWNCDNLGHFFNAGQCSSDMTLHPILRPKTLESLTVHWSILRVRH